MPRKLKRAFYLNEDVLTIAKNLLGKTLITNIDGKKSGGIIVETEAYSGLTDKASHAWPKQENAKNACNLRGGWNCLCLPVLWNSPII